MGLGMRILRVQVSFWKVGYPDEARIGFTTDVSQTGLFIATNRPLATGNEIAVMIDEQCEPFLVSGDVVRAIKVPPLLQRIKTSGMGIRFHDLHEAAIQRLHDSSLALAAPISY